MHRRLADGLFRGAEAVEGFLALAVDGFGGAEVDAIAGEGGGGEDLGA